MENLALESCPPISRGLASKTLREIGIPRSREACVDHPRVKRNVPLSAVFNTKGKSSLYLTRISCRNSHLYCLTFCYFSRGSYSAFVLFYLANTVFIHSQRCGSHISHIHTHTLPLSQSIDLISRLSLTSSLGDSEYQRKAKKMQGP